MSNEINIQISNVCNLKCNFCARNWVSIEKRKPYIDILDFFNIVDICTKNGIDTFCLTPTMGEVFLIPHLFSMLDYLESNKKVSRYFFSTNFTIPNKELIKKVIGYKKLGLQISVYGFDKKTFKKNTNVDNFINFEKSLEILLKNIPLKKCNIELCVRFPFGKYPDDLPRNRSALIIKLLIFSYGVRINENEQLNFNLGGIINYDDIDTMYGPHEKKGVCPTAQVGCIYENGDFGLCYMNDIYRKHVLGNVFKHSMKTLYKRIKKITDKQAEGIYDGICERCDERWEIYSTSYSSRKQ